MNKRLVTLYLDEATVEALRRIAVQRGLVCKTGPGAPIGRGNISELVIALAHELSTMPS